MFVGHGLLAFSLVAGGAGLAGSDRRRALAFGVAAAVFATVPDVDMAYALVGLVGAGDAGPLALASAFWSTGNVVHRAVTHSLLVAGVAAVAATAWTAGLGGRRGGRAVAIALLAALVAVAAVASGPLGGAVMALFGAALLAVVTVLVRRASFDAREVAAPALVGLVSHPFGDLFTGTPPRMLYPLDATLVVERVTLAPDPTIHLLAAFGLELATAWLAALVVARLYGARVLPAPRATLGVGYAAALPLVPAPTLELSYPFVFSVLGLGTLVLVPGLVRAVRDTDGAAVPRVARAPLTGLAAVTLAWAAYGVAYAAL